MKVWRSPYPKFGTGICFHRVGEIARALHLDLAEFGPSGAVIAGSNGKGSTAAMLASSLPNGGVGLFTSPHLFALNERFKIDGDDISDAELECHWARVRTAADACLAGRAEALGGFEFLFLIAASWFAARGAAYTVWEAGIGGRYDPTRLIRPARTSVVSLDFEHTALLGETLEAIAYDKIDATPAGARVFLGESCAHLRREIEAYCALRDVAPIFVSLEEIAAETPPLAGPHQRNNAALARRLARDMASSVRADEIDRGLAATRWPGRLEIIGGEPLIVIDVGHTPDAIRRAREGFEALRGAAPAILVCGASSDKNAAGMIAALAPGFSHIICAAARHKGAPAAEIARHVREISQAEISVADSVADARRIALAKAHALGAAIYVAGGLFLAVEFKAVHQGLDPDLLAFF